MCNLQIAICLAQKMGKKLGRCQVLQRKMSKNEVEFYWKVGKL